MTEPAEDFPGGRRVVAERAADLAALTPGRSGNLSVRDGDRVAVTPSGVPYDDLAADDVPVISTDSDRLHGNLEPSSETPMHLAVYDARDAGAVLHAHAPWATTLAALREPLPAVHYAVARAGSEVPVAEYATYGTPDLAANAAAAMERADSDACLLANHGLLAAGADAADAFETAQAVEFTARVYCQASAVGEPAVLPDDEIERVARKFEEYGQSG
jgi:L-fuculose-phosphate aldolase